MTSRPASTRKRSGTRVLLASLVALSSVAVATASDHDVVPASALAGIVRAEPVASLDLTSQAGLAAIQGTWRFSDTRIVDTVFPAAGPEGQPTGPLAASYDVAPRAGGRDFDDRDWATIAPGGLTTRRGAGRISFVWYRLRILVPERIDGHDTTGHALVLDLSLDDYAEVWVDGELPRQPRQQGGSVVGGWNASNRLVVGRDVRPGQVIQLAVFGINGPLSDPPTNFVWLRHARLDLVRAPAGPTALPLTEVNLEVRDATDRLHALLGRNPKLIKLAEGFAFTEGPVWRPESRELLFSDPNRNTIYRYGADGTLGVFRHPSGYAGADIAAYRQPGSNGLALDRMGRVTVNEHGNRRVVRLDGDTATVLADRFEGRRLNSPNDLVYRSDGALFFTDPPFGLPAAFDDGRKELPYSGVFALRDGALRLVTRDLTGPNGLAFSPDERTLYVGNWDDRRKVVMRYDIAADGSASGGRVFADLTSVPGEDAIDGVKVDADGNVYVSGPGGLHVFAPSGDRLGTIVTPRHVHNMAWGDDDGRTLYLCARDHLYRMRVAVPGATFTSRPRLEGTPQ
jgi:gluconolactonase